jgi:hypothetical protein
MSYVTSYCSIKKGHVRLNGKKIFSSEDSFPDFMERLYTQLNPDYSKFYKMDNLSKLGFLACEVLLKNKNASRNVQEYDVALVLSNSSGSLDTDSRYNEVSKKVASPATFVYTLANIVNGEVCIRHGFKGENVFFVTPQFDTDLVCAYCDGLLEEKSKICVAGWIEVMGNEYEAFLYVAENEREALSIEHNPQNLKNLYSE